MSEYLGGRRSRIQSWTGCGMRGRRCQGCLPRCHDRCDDNTGGGAGWPGGEEGCRDFSQCIQFGKAESKEWPEDSWAYALDTQADARA